MVVPVWGLFAAWRPLCAALGVCVGVTLCAVNARNTPDGTGGAPVSAGFRGSRAGSGRIGRALRGAAPSAGGLDPVCRARWVLVGHLGDMVDVASAAGDSVAVSRLSLSVLRVLAALEVRAPKGERAEGVSSPDDDDGDRPLSVDEQYERLCAELGDPAES